MTEFSPEEIFSPLKEYQGVEQWDCKTWRQFCRLLAETFVFIPGIDKDYTDYFWNEVSDHEALQQPPVSSELDDEGDEDDEYDDKKPENDVSHLPKQQDPKQLEVVATDSSDASNTDHQKENPTKELPRALENQTKLATSEKKGTSASGQAVSEASNLEIVDLNVLSESDIRSILPSEDKSLLILVTLKGGDKAWCNYRLLREKKQVVGDEMLEALDEAEQNMQNNDVGK